MPMNPRKMLHRTKAEEQELRIKSELYVLKNAERFSRPRKNTKMAELTQTIYDIFDDRSVSTKSLRAIPAQEFQYLYDLYSPNTMVKAKKILGIKSRRKGGVWWWSFPVFPPTEALSASHNEKLKEINEAEEELKKLYRPSSLAFQGIMIDHKFYAPNIEVLSELAANGYSRGTALKTKADLNIPSIKVDGKWMWVWAHRDVQDWLELQLSNGPRTVESLKLEAFADHGWHWQVILCAQKVMRHIEWRIYNDMGYWVDINRHAENDAFIAKLPKKVQPQKHEPKVDIKMLAPAVTNEIVVDFEEEEDENYD